MSVKGGDVIFQFKSDDKELQKSVNEMGTSIKKMVAALGLDKLISKTMSALNNSLDGAIKRVDTLNNFPRVMNNLGIATEDATEAVNELSDGLLGLPTTLNDGVSAVQRFTSQNNDVKKSTKIFLALNNAILAGGASTEVQASAMEQLSQAYAKGKPDAMEWRSMLTAMPAQLKQVAKAMGYTSTAVGGDLYNAIQKGKVSMDDFMDTIIRLDKEGVGEFASFAEQAKSSTGGIATSITNVKTAITRGLANGIEALNSSLKKANLPTVNDMIQNLGTAITNAFKKISIALSNINWKKIIPIFKDFVQYIKNLKNNLLGFVKEVFKKIDWDMVLKIAPTILKIVATVKILNPLIKTGTSIITSFSKVIKGLSNPVNLAITVITALATAFTYLSGNLNKHQQESKRVIDSVVNLRDELDEYSNSLKSNASNELAHIEKTQQLNNELRNLVDENGKVKEGYEERVKFILNQLNEALGTEYKLNGNIIENYKEIQTQTDGIIEKKKAEIKLEASKNNYLKAVEKEKEISQNLNDTLKQLGMTYDEAIEKSKEYKKKTDEGTLSLADFQDETYFLIQAFDESTKQMEWCTNAQKQYTEDATNFEKQAYKEVGKDITISTEKWTDKTEQELRDNINTQSQSLTRLQDLYKQYGTDLYAQQLTESAKSIALLKSELQTRTGLVQQFTPNEVEAFIRLAQKDRQAFNDILSQTSGDTRKTLQNIASTIDTNGYIPENSIRSVANAMASPFEEVRNNAYTWGTHLMSNLNSGINNNKGRLFSTIYGIAEGIRNTLGHSHPKERSNERRPKMDARFCPSFK